MQPKSKPLARHWPARLSIWSIRNHDAIVVHLRYYVWSATATILLLSLGGLVSLTTALNGILVSALSLTILIWLFLERRRTILLRIDDPDLRREAEAAMHAFVYARRKRICGNDPVCLRATASRKPVRH